MESTPSARAQQVLQRFAVDPMQLNRKIASRLAIEEGKAKAGAWDWKSWGEKFYQLLQYRRFVPHPVLLATAERPEFPHSWFFAPRNDRAALIQALQILREKRAFAGLRFHTKGLEANQLFQVFQEFAVSLDTYFTKMPKPYPELEAIVPAHDSSLHDFLALEATEKRQCRRTLSIELSQGLQNHELIYEAVLREAHVRLREKREVKGIYFQPFERGASGMPEQELPFVGALNLSEFVDSSTGKFLWDELKSALATSIRLVLSWRQASLSSDGDAPAALPENSTLRVWIGLTGWDEALHKLDLEYAEERARDLMWRFAGKIRGELFDAERRLELQKGLAPGSLRFSLRPTYSRFIGQVTAVRVGLVPEPAMGQEEALMRMQAAFFGGNRGIFTLPNPEKLEPEAFVQLLNSAARSGWGGVRFL